MFSSIIYNFKQIQMKESLLKRSTTNASPYALLTLDYNKTKQIIQCFHLSLN